MLSGLIATGAAVQSAQVLHGEGLTTRQTVMAARITTSVTSTRWQMVQAASTSPTRLVMKVVTWAGFLSHHQCTGEVTYPVGVT